MLSIRKLESHALIIWQLIFNFSIGFHSCSSLFCISYFFLVKDVFDNSLFSYDLFCWCPAAKNFLSSHPLLTSFFFFPVSYTYAFYAVSTVNGAWERCKNWVISSFPTSSTTLHTSRIFLLFSCKSFQFLLYSLFSKIVNNLLFLLAALFKQQWRIEF